MEFEKVSEFEEELGKAIVNVAYKVHSEMGPGYDGIPFEEGLRLDLMVENKIIVEIKALDQVNPVWQAQVLSHLKLTGLRLGNLINFNVPLIKDGIKRIIL